jgi:Rps23 Pro-64 3,4-dihydroxylase Tpa1-like proline 4-hydroxylase
MQNLEYEILDLGLVYYKNIVKDPNKLIQEIEDLEIKVLNTNQKNKTLVEPWTNWTYSDEKVFCKQKFIPQQKDINPSVDIFYKEQVSISKQLFGALDETFNHYTVQLYPWANANIKSREDRMHLLKYTSGGYLPAHQDQGVSSRVLSVLLYLNDDYEGGEIEFQHSKIKIKPEAGSVIFFPSNFLYVHEVHPIVSGTRYSLPNWYHNVPNEKRKHSTGEE